MPQRAKRALASASLLLLVKPGAPDEAGVPGLHLLRMLEVLRRLVGWAPMAAMLPAARRFSSPTQREIGTSGTFADHLHELDARLALARKHGLLLLAFKMDFNLILRAAACEVLRQEPPLLAQFFQCTGGIPPPMYGWTWPAEDDEVPVRWWHPVA